MTNTRFFRFLSTGCAVLLGLALAPTQALAVDVSVGIGGEVFPGVYGTVNIDNGRYPALVYEEPLIVSRPSRALAPVYLHVPPKHLRKWDRYCARYNACSQPVYFVRSADYYDSGPLYIEPRPVYREYRDRVTYVYHGDDGRRRDYHERHERRRDYHPHREHREHHHAHRDHSRHGHRGHDGKHESGRYN